MGRMVFLGRMQPQRVFFLAWRHYKEYSQLPLHTHNNQCDQAMNSEAFRQPI
jgi:hypothetical protein